MNRYRQLCWISLWLMFLSGCAESTAGPTDSETHFLHQCKDHCAQGLACICGVCTKTCDDDQGCSALPADPTCVAPELLDDIRACHPSDPIDEAVCDVVCESDSECKALGKGFICQSGFCRESVASAPEVDSSIEEDSSVFDSESTIDSPDATVVEDSEVTTEESAIFSGGLAPGERAPAIGDAPWNAYGGPAEPLSMVVGYPRFYPEGTPRVEFLELCESEPNSWTATLEDLDRQPCVVYFMCENFCESDPSGSDCDDGGSGDATPVCIDFYCELRCDDQRSCPDGMVCITDVRGGTCWWPIDIAAPGCPAWCETDPLPTDCPNWCASKGVACAAESDVCCEGLTCGPDGLCIEDNEA